LSRLQATALGWQVIVIARDYQGNPKKSSVLL
jgi:hypothetical protein